MQELHFLKGMIIEKPDNKLGEGTIRDIRFKTGHVPSLGDKKMDFSDVYLDDEIKKMEKESSGISDPEVSEAFHHLMETHLKSKKDE